MARAGSEAVRVGLPELDSRTARLRNAVGTGSPSVSTAGATQPGAKGRRFPFSPAAADLMHPIAIL